MISRRREDEGGGKSLNVSRAMARLKRKGVEADEDVGDLDASNVHGVEQSEMRLHRIQGGNRGEEGKTARTDSMLTRQEIKRKREIIVRQVSSRE